MTNSTLESINNLTEVFYIAGQDEVFYFNVLDSNGAVQDITGATCSWKLYPIGQTGNSSACVLTLSGVITDAAGGIWKVTIPGSSTLGLYGVYQQVPRISDFTGTKFYPSMGIVNIQANS